jgi:oligopeptidase A
MVALKHERANLLGYNTYADFTLAERMAGSSDRVFSFIHDMLGPYHKAAKRDLDDLKSFAGEHCSITDLQPWDVAYIREKLQADRYALNSEELRPYFPLQKVLTGTFAHFEKTVWRGVYPRTRLAHLAYRCSSLYGY